MENKNKISVVINTYNAEQHLEKCLQAVKDFDEVVVCDMESTDSTVSIAHRYGCRVVTFPKNGHTCCEPARQTAIDSASYPWVLVVDADELITPELRDLLYRLIQEDNVAEGYYIPRKNMFMSMYVRDFHDDYILRFVRRDLTEWPPIIHVVPTIKGRVEKLPTEKNAYMLHLMDETMHEYMDKMNQYTDNEVEKKKDKHYGVWALLWRPFWRFFKKYFMDGSFRMGKRGLIRSMMAACYQFVLISKIMEKKYRD